MTKHVARDRVLKDRSSWSAREIARRNREALGKPLSPVMKTAATACELAHGPAAEDGGRGQPPSHSGEAEPTNTDRFQPG